MRKEFIFIVVKVLLLCAIAFFLYQGNVVQLIKEGYLEIQKAAYEGKDVQSIISSLLIIGSLFFVFLTVLLFVFSPHFKTGLFFFFLFFLLLLTTTLLILNIVFKEKIADYLKTTYQPEQTVLEVKN